MVKSNTAGSLLLMKGFPLAGSGKANRAAFGSVHPGSRLCTGQYP
jgi:hypothetical protein